MIPALDDLGIRLLMARTGISREDATVMWYAPQLLEACKFALKDGLLDGNFSCTSADKLNAAIERAEGR